MLVGVRLARELVANIANISLNHVNSTEMVSHKLYLLRVFLPESESFFLQYFEYFIVNVLSNEVHTRGVLGSQELLH